MRSWLPILLLACHGAPEPGPPVVRTDPASDSDVPGDRSLIFGDEFQVNEVGGGRQSHATLAVDGDGHWLVAYDLHASLDVVAARVLDADLQEVRTEWVVSNPERAASHAQVTATGGGFLVVWQEEEAKHIRLREFGLDGQPRTGELVVVEVGAGAVSYPDVAVSRDAVAAVVWYQRAPAGARYVGRTYEGGLSTPGVVFTLPRIDESATGGPPAVDGSQALRFVMAWGERSDAGGAVYAQPFDTGGRPDGPPLPVVSGGVGVSRPSVAVHRSGSFAVAWRDHEEASDQGLGAWFRAFDATGTPLYEPVRLDASGAGDRPVVAAAGGRLVVVWEEPDRLEYGIWLAVYDFATGEALTPAVRVNEWVAGSQRRPDLAVRQDGDGVWGLVTWESDGGQDGQAKGVFARRFALGARAVEPPRWDGPPARGEGSGLALP